MQFLSKSKNTQFDRNVVLVLQIFISPAWKTNFLDINISIFYKHLIDDIFLITSLHLNLEY